jgi:hypothetical protein
VPFLTLFEDTGFEKAIAKTSLKLRGNEVAQEMMKMT